MEIRTLQNTKRNRNREFLLQIHSRKTSESCNTLKLSDLNFKEKHFFENDITEFVPMLYKALANRFPNIRNINVETPTADSVISEMLEFLKNEFLLYDVNFISTKKGKRIHIYKEFNIDERNVWFFFTKPIFEFRYKSPKLFNILIAFFKSIPFGDMRNGLNSVEYYVDSAKMMLNDEKENQGFFDDDEIIAIKKGLKGIKKMNKAFDNFKGNLNWKDELKKYHPRKSKYKEIKKALIKAQNINFQIPVQVVENTILSDKNIIENKEERKIIFSENFATLYDFDTITKDYVMKNMDYYINEFGKIPALDEMIIDENGNVISEFSFKEKEIITLTEFIYEFNETLNDA